MKRYQTYIFDFDGTLVDTEASLFPVFQRGFQAVGREVTPEEVGTYMHISLRQTIELTKIPEDKAQLFVDSIVEALDAEESIALIQLFEDTLPVIRALKESGAKIAVASNNVSGHIHLVLERFGIEDLFDTCVGSNDVEHTKPAPDLLWKVCQNLGTPRENAIYVGDSLQDYATAEAGQIDGVLIDRRHEHENFPGKRIFSLRELLS